MKTEKMNYKELTELKEAYSKHMKIANYPDNFFEKIKIINLKPFTSMDIDGQDITHEFQIDELENMKECDNINVFVEYERRVMEKMTLTEFVKKYPAMKV